MLDPQASRFWQAALLSGLMDAQVLTACWEAISPAKREAPEHIDRRLARQAVQLKALTLWQAQQLLAGRTSGFKVDRYVLLDLIGQGGMGRVYLARDSRLNRRVALKILSPERMSNPRAIARFQREARVGAQLQHENLVRIYDFGESSGRHYLVMEYIEGKTIGTLISEQGLMPPASAVRLVLQVALGLEHAHRKGLIHRDVNPYNVLVTRDGTAKLADLGLAIDLADDNHVTREGATVGTFDYVAPEQARHSHSADIRSDIYSLGCTLYHMCAGRVPFPSPSLPEKLFAHQALEPTPLDQLVPGLPVGLTEVVQRMMRKSPDDRYATPMQVVQVLEPYADETSIIGNHASGSVLAQKPTAKLSPGSLRSDDSKAPALRQPGAEPALVRTVAVPDGSEIPLVPVTEFGSGANAGEQTASLLSPVSNHDATDAEFPLVLNLGPEPSLSEGRSRPKPRSVVDYLASAARTAAPVRRLAPFWLWGLIALSVTVTVLLIIVATVNPLGDTSERNANSTHPTQHAGPKSTFPHVAESANKPPRIVPKAALGIVIRTLEDQKTEDDQDTPAENLFEAMQTVMGSDRYVELRNREPLHLAGDQCLDFISGRGRLIIRAAPGIQPVIEIDMKGANKPFLATGSGVTLEMSGLTIVVHYPEPGAALTPPPVIAAAGIATKINRCAFKVVAGPHVKNSRAIVSEGGALGVDRCWFEGFDKAIELSAFGGIPARIQQTMIVPAPGLARSQAQPRELYGWGVRVLVVSGGGAQTKNLPPHLVLEHCTVEGAGLLDLAFSPVSVPLRVEVKHCAVQTEAILAYEPGQLDAPTTARFHWLGESNQYNILGRYWIVFSASQGTPAFSTAVTDLVSWLRFTPDDSNAIRTKLKFVTDPATRPALPQPHDFAIESPGTPQTKPGANPELVEPGSSH